MIWFFKPFVILFAKGKVKVFPSFLIFIIFANGILSICIFYIFAKGLKEYFSFCKRNGGGFSFDKLLQFHFRREEQSVCLIKSADITFLKKSILNFCACNYCLDFHQIVWTQHFASPLVSPQVPFPSKIGLWCCKSRVVSISTQPFVVNLVSFLVDFHYQFELIFVVQRPKVKSLCICNIIKDMN